MGYRDQVGGSGKDGIPGFMLKKKDAPHETFLPPWGDGKKTVFRAFPQIVGNEEQPWRIGPIENDFGDQMLPVKMVRFWGAQEKLSFVTSIKGADRSVVDPTTKFFKAIEKAVKSKDPTFPLHWADWLVEGKNQGASLSMPKMHLLMQGMLFCDGDKWFVNAVNQVQPKVPVLLVLPSSGRKEVEVMLNEEVQGYQGDRSNYATRFKMGDIFSCAHGHPFEIYKAPPRHNETAHYAVLPCPQEYPVPVDYVKNLWMPWDDVVNYLTEAEQLALIERAFTAEAVDYVFGMTDLAQFLKPETRGAYARFQSAPRSGPAYGRQHYEQPQAPQQPPPPQAPAGFTQQPPPQAPAGFQPPQAAPAGFQPPPAAPAGFQPPTAPAGFPGAPAGFPQAPAGFPGGVPAGFPQAPPVGTPAPAAPMPSAAPQAGAPQTAQPAAQQAPTDPLASDPRVAAAYAMLAEARQKAANMGAAQPGAAK